MLAMATRFDNLTMLQLADGVEWSSADWQRLLDSPLRHSLRGVDFSLQRLFCTADEEVLSQLLLLERFDTLGLPAKQATLPLFSLLPAAPNLTSVTVALPFSIAYGIRHTAVETALSHCSLRRLELHHPLLLTDHFDRLLAGTALSRSLEHLTLYDWTSCRDKQSQETRSSEVSAEGSGFASLLRLHTVVLERIEFDVLLPALASAPALCQLTMVTSAAHKPSASAVQRLLAANSLLHVSVRCSSWAGDAMAERWWNELRACAPRVSIDEVKF